MEEREQQRTIRERSAAVAAVITNNVNNATAAANNNGSNNGGKGNNGGTSPTRLLTTGGATAKSTEANSPGDGEDGGFQERIPRKASVETQTMNDDSLFQRKITPRVPKSKKSLIFVHRKLKIYKLHAKVYVDLGST